MRKPLFALALILNTLWGCGKQQYTIGFPPSHEEITQMENLLPLKQKLEQLTGWELRIYVAEDYDDLRRKIEKGVVQIAFLPPLLYVDVMDRMDMIMKVVRHGKGFYRGEILTVPGIDSLMQLKGSNWAFPDKNSTSGYLLPVYYFMKHGVDPDTFFNYQYEAGSHDAAVILLLRGNVQVATVFDDARALVSRDYPDVYERTRVLAYTDSIPNDGIAVIKEMSVKNRKKLMNAFRELGKDELLKTIMDRLFGGDEFVEASADEYEIVKKIKEAVRK